MTDEHDHRRDRRLRTDLDERRPSDDDASDGPAEATVRQRRRVERLASGSAQLQAMIDALAIQAGPVRDRSSAKAAELAASGRRAAGPVAARAAEFDGRRRPTKSAERSRDLATRAASRRSGSWPRPRSWAPIAGRRRPTRMQSAAAGRSPRRASGVAVARARAGRPSDDAAAGLDASRSTYTPPHERPPHRPPRRPAPPAQGQAGRQLREVPPRAARRPRPHDARRTGRRARRAAARRGDAGLRHRGRGPAATSW